MVGSISSLSDVKEIQKTTVDAYQVYNTPTTEAAINVFPRSPAIYRELARNRCNEGTVHYTINSSWDYDYVVFDNEGQRIRVFCIPRLIQTFSYSNEIRCLTSCILHNTKSVPYKIGHRYDLV